MSRVSAGNNTTSRATCFLRATGWADLFCVMETQWVYCDVGTSFRNITWLNNGVNPKVNTVWESSLTTVTFLQLRATLQRMGRDA